MMTLLVGVSWLWRRRYRLPLTLMLRAHLVMPMPSLCLGRHFGLSVFVYFMLRFDLIGYRYEPTLFDRNAGKVHVFKDNTRLFSWWPLWGGGGQHEILSYDWPACAPRSSASRPSPAPWRRTTRPADDRAAAPGDTRVVGQFGLGLTSSAIAVQPLLDTWEHIPPLHGARRAAVREGDGPNEALFEMRLARCLFFGQPFIGPGSAEHWKHPDLAPSSGRSSPSHSFR